jgi:hypothetical protein
MSPRRFKPDTQVPEWQGPTVRYDLLKEVTVCFFVVLALVVGLSIVFSSPDDKPVTLKSWSNTAPIDFVTTAITELDGTSPTASYGPPYTNTPGAGQKLGPVALEHVTGVTIPIDTAKDFVIDPLMTLPSRTVRADVSAYEGAGAPRQQRWTAAFEKGVAKASFVNGHLQLPKLSYGPVLPMMSDLLSMARSGALDGALLATPQLYGTDYTKPLLFLADGTYMADLAQARHLLGTQWGMMNETGNFPGQAWLWLYTMWYQIPPWSTSSNGDVLVWATMMVLTLLLILVPFIPGLRSIPRWTRVYRLIWRRYYRSVEAPTTT